MTFLFTDVVGSTRRWAADGESMGADLARHDAVVLDCVDSAGGYVFSKAGDSFAVAFSSARQGLMAAMAIQSALESVQWAGSKPLLVRIGLHAGEALERAGDYFGPSVNTAARIMAAANGGQIIVSESVRYLVDFEGIDLGVHVLRDVDAGLRLFQVGTQSFAPLATARTVSATLPRQRTAFVGREQDLSTVKNQLLSQMMVTIVGPGGVGKTRLAIEIAAEVAAQFSGGVSFVDLAPVSRDADVARAFASAVGVPSGTQPLERALVEFLGSRASLVVVDNCEHLIEAVAELIDELLVAAPQLVVLATSREALDIDGEVVLNLKPLDASTAVRLFIDRASAASSELSVQPSDLEVIERICARLDGIPLAIELAAARASVLTLAEIQQQLSDRFELLGPGRRRRLRRQQTLETTIDWSYALLSPVGQEALRRLCVFEGWFQYDDVAALLDAESGSPQATVDELVAKSVLTRGGTRSGVTRYRFLESIREFARMRLIANGEADQAWQRYQHHVVNWIATKPIAEHDTSATIERLSDGWADVVATAEAVDQRDRIRLAGGLTSAMPDAERILGWLQDLDEREDLDARERGAALRTKGSALVWLGRIDELQDVLDASGLTLATAQNEEELCFASLTSFVEIYADPTRSLETGRVMIDNSAKMPNSGYAAPTGAMVVAASLLRGGRFEPAAEIATEWLPRAPVGGLTNLGLATIAVVGYDLVGHHDNALAAWASLGEHPYAAGWKGMVALGTALTTAHHLDPPTARHQLAAAAQAQANFQDAGQLHHYVTTFGRLHWLEENNDRASQLLRRSTASAPSLYGDIYAVEYDRFANGWPIEEFAKRITETPTEPLDLGTLQTLLNSEIETI
ncbi:MAG: adenylate/guanylate cyclase domain-containing protein [Acidimicrobiia bacterium]|nr:adenylate/guanylate cyclase domain-containing protein [Acidimicrobiia bacterium]